LALRPNTTMAWATFRTCSRWSSTKWSSPHGSRRANFECLPVCRVKALTDKFPNVQQFAVLENGWQSLREIKWDAANHVKQVVRQAVNRDVELHLEAEGARLGGDNYLWLS
jgi:hypothetical protein